MIVTASRSLASGGRGASYSRSTRTTLAFTFRFSRAGQDSETNFSNECLLFCAKTVPVRPYRAYQEFGGVATACAQSRPPSCRA